MTPVSDDFPSCCLHPTVYHGVFQHVYMCVSIPFSSSSPSPFLFLLHLHFCHRLPGIPPVGWLCGFICHLFFSRLPRPSLSISNRLPYARMRVHACCVSPCVCVCAAANSFPLSRQTANCCCCEEYGSPLLLLLICSPPTERMTCVIVLEQMIACVCQQVYVCIFCNASVYGSRVILSISLTGLNDAWLLAEASN